VTSRRARLAGLAWALVLGPAVRAASPQVRPPQIPVETQGWVQLSNADWGYYERLYGEAITMSIDTLLDEPHVAERQAIRTFGLFQIPLGTMNGRPGSGVQVPRPPRIPSAGDDRAAAGFERAREGQLFFELCGEAKGRRCLAFVPVAEIGPNLEAQTQSFNGQTVMIVGALDKPGFVVWSFEAMPKSAGRGKGGADSGLRAVVAAAGAAGKSEVRVRGQFRGRNLFGDLPAESQRGRSDWVIFDQGVALWITGKAPKGSGWSLDLDNRSESARWIEVEGEPSARDGVVYLKARSVSLVSGPLAPPEEER